MRPRGLFLLFWLAAMTPAPAQTASVPLPDTAVAPEPAALTALRNRFAASAAAADRATLSQWITALATLEHSRADAGDYEGAERIRLRREELLAQTGTGDGRLRWSLTPADGPAKGPGMTVADNKASAVFKISGAWLEWEITGDFKGWYEMHLTHAVAGEKDRTAEIVPSADTTAAVPRSKRNPAPSEQAGGQISLRSAGTLAARNAPVLRRRIVSTGGWSAWRTVSLGRMEITGRTVKFRLAADEAFAEGLMSFRSLTLVPVNPPVVTADLEESFMKARETFVRTFQNQVQASSASYRDRLNALEKEAAQKGDNDLAIRIREERTMLREAPERLALGLTGESGPGADGPVSLDLVSSIRCQYRGDIVLNGSGPRANLTKLRPAGVASVTWRLPDHNIGSGTYTVNISGRVPPGGGGSASLAAFDKNGAPAGKPVTIKVKAPHPAPRNRKPAGDGDKGEDTVSLEPVAVTIGKGAETLVLSVQSLHEPGSSLMDVSAVTLTRKGSLPGS